MGKEPSLKATLFVTKSCLSVAAFSPLFFDEQNTCCNPRILFNLILKWEREREKDKNCHLQHQLEQVVGALSNIHIFIPLR